MRSTFTSFLASLFAAMLLLTSGAATPSQAASVTMQDLSGASHSIPNPSAKATVLLFVSKDCPYSNGAAPEMKRIADLYSKQGFAFYFVYGSPFGNAAATKQHALAYGFNEPCVLDVKQVLVKDSAATTTPEAVVISPAAKVLYRGRIDNKYDAIGVQRTVVTEHDLTDALDAIEVGKAPPHAYERPIGCTIPPAQQ
jgi:hypothetical protein